MTEDRYGIVFARGELNSDDFVKFCYGHYRDIMSQYGADLPKSLEIIREEGQKPRFDSEEVFFNLSHSHGVIMLGISHTPIGVDIEKIRDIDYKKFTFIDAEDLEDFFENGRKERVISNGRVRDCPLLDARSQKTRISSIFPFTTTITLASARTSKAS